MKFLKILFIFIVVVIVLLGVLLFVALQTLKPERIKAIAEEKISVALNRPTTIKSLDLGLSLQTGLNFQAQGVVVKDFFEVDTVRLKLDAKRFMTKKEIVIPTVLIERPRIEWTPESTRGLPIATDHAGQDHPPGSSGSPGKPETEDIAEFHIDEIIIRDGHFHFQDNVDGRPVDVTVSRLNLSVEDFGLDRPFPYTLNFGLMTGDRPLVDIKGQAVIQTKSRQLRVNDLDVAVLLKNLDLKEVQRNAPELSGAGLDKIEDGQLKFRVPELVMGEQGLTGLHIDGVLDNLRIRAAQVPVPVTTNAAVRADAGKIVLQEMRVGLGDGSVSGTAEVADYLGTQDFKANVKLDKLQLADLVDLSQMNLQVRANLNGSLEASGKGFDEADLKTHLRGSSVLRLEEAKILDFNLLDYVLGQLPKTVKLGGLENLFTGLHSGLGARYQTQFEKKDTVFDVTDIVIKISEGRLWLEQTDFGAKGYFIRASGDLGLDGQLVLRSEMFLSPEISRDLIKKAPDMAILQDQSGHIRIPFAPYKGPVTALGPPLPDLKNFVKQYYEVRGKQELKNVLRKALDIEDKAAPAVTGTQQLDNKAGSPKRQPEPAAEDILIDALDGLLKKF